MELVLDKTYLYTVKHKVMPIVYIGITKNPQARFADHKRCSSNKLLRKYISELGAESFNFLICTEGTREDMEELEHLAIVEAKSLLNITVCNVVEGSPFTGGCTQYGETHWNAKFSLQDIQDIREIYSFGGITQKEIGEIYGCSNKVISKITSGSRWVSQEGPISVNLTVNKVANRRKLSDAEVIKLRNLAFEIYSNTNNLSIPTMAQEYNIARNNMRYILNGKSYPELPGPILGKDYYFNWGKKHGK